MKEQFYIELEVRKNARQRMLKMMQEEKPNKSATCFNMCFPSRECRPVVRRRTLAEVWKLIEETSEE